MTDCTGYGFSSQMNLCLRGPVGKGHKANLDIKTGNASGWEFNGDTITVPDWDGRKVEVDLTSALTGSGLSGAICDVEARLTITPDSKNTYSGTMLLEFIFTNCVDDNSNDPNVYEECGGAGPHIVSEMSTFTLDGIACI
ncbi:MAG: hypothetical protein GY697_07205 [Desulfobacterales bacterium]|nr:hypothetical protein [Desulfobacterales bacterium]